MKSLFCLYADDGLIENSNPTALQSDLDTIIKLFEKVGLKTNKSKTKFMVVQGAKAPTAQSIQTYNNIRMGITKTQWRKQLMTCEKCRKQLQRRLLQRHMLQQHNLEPAQYLCRPVGTNSKFFITFKQGEINNCPIPGCMGSSRDKFGMYCHFVWRHNDATIVINQDRTLPKCNLCGMRSKNLQQHQGTDTCKQLQK